MGLSVDNVLDEISVILKEKNNYSHPLWKGMVDGTHNLEQVKYFCHQHSIITLHNHNYHGRIYVACPDPDWRERIAEVSYEEATGRLFANGVSHHKLYLNYAKSLGISREELYATNYCAGAVMFKTYMNDVCSRFLEGVSVSMLAGEAQIPGLYGKIANTLKEKFDIGDEGLQYWIVHDTADEDHSSAGRELLDKFATTEEDMQLVLKSVNDMMNVMFLMYDDIWNTAKHLH